MLLLEGVPFIGRDKPKPIQQWSTSLNIELVESMSEPSKGIPYGMDSSPFAKFLMFNISRENVMSFYLFP
jgi:hypothetical protein